MARLASVILTVVIMVLLGFGIHWTYGQWQMLHTSPSTPSKTAVEQLWETTLNDDDGKTHVLKQYMGKPLIVNFWATWCDPCREEMPEISELAQQHPEIAVIGLAIDEAPAVHEFKQTTPVGYPLLIAENEGMLLAEALGNHKAILPYTVVIAADGQVLKTFFGRINKEMLLNALQLDSFSQP